MTNLYKTVFPWLENQRTGHQRKQDKRENYENLLGFAVIGLATFLGLGVSNFLIAHQPEKEKLEDHPMCGKTAGGKVSIPFQKTNSQHYFTQYWLQEHLELTKFLSPLF